MSDFGINATVLIFDEAVKDDHVRIAVLELGDHGVSLNWLSLLFSPGTLNDKLRKHIVEVLRLHADKLESREMDQRMAEVMGNESGIKDAN